MRMDSDVICNIEWHVSVLMCTMPSERHTIYLQLMVPVLQAEIDDFSQGHYCPLSTHRIDVSMHTCRISILSRISAFPSFFLPAPANSAVPLTIAIADAKPRRFEMKGNLRALANV